ncbi:MAG: glycosyltransferase [Chloroflexi bacterium]|nr:glycosyltransferase [Chloroflexota bacterium]
MILKRLAILSVHTSPLAKLGGSKTGGMNVYVREIAQELGRRGLAVDIYTRRADSGWPVVDHSLGRNVRVIHITAGAEQELGPDEVYPHLAQFTAGVLAFTTGDNTSYDLIYSHYWLSGLVAHALHEVWGIPFVQMFHTLGHMKNRILMNRGASLPPDVRVHNETQIVGWANQIVAATAAEQAQLLWLYRADRRKIAVIPPGVNADRFKPIARADARAQLGLPPERQLLLFVGRIEPLKGVDTVLQALARLGRQSPNLLDTVRFAVIGGDLNNAELTRLRQFSADLGLEDCVEFLGAKDQAQLPLYYAASLAVVMPSDYESFGMVALEAMACGTPVIASQVGGLAYLIRDGETGFLVPVREPDALAERIGVLLADPHQREEMGQAAARLARQYTWPAITDRLLQLFQRVLEQRRINRHTSSAHPRL